MRSSTFLWLLALRSPTSSVCVVLPSRSLSGVQRKKESPEWLEEKR
jgi:hypothetical protein